jgi:hypothetical protein
MSRRAAPGEISTPAPARAVSQRLADSIASGAGKSRSPDASNRSSSTGETDRTHCTTSAHDRPSSSAQSLR